MRGVHSLGRTARRRITPGYLQPQTLEKTRWQRLQIVHALWNKPLPKAIVEQAIIGKRASGQRINRRVANDDA